MLQSVLLLSFIFVGPVVSEEATGPRIEISEMRYDFGKITQGMQASHVFTVRSAGSETLIIEKIQSS
jgi:hypothetical protein